MTKIEQFNTKRGNQHPPEMAYPAMMDICEAEFPDYTSPIKIYEGVNDIKDDKNKKHDEKKEAELPDDTSPVEM